MCRLSSARPPKAKPATRTAIWNTSMPWATRQPTCRSAARARTSRRRWPARRTSTPTCIPAWRGRRATTASARSPTGSRPSPRPSAATPTASRRRWMVSAIKRDSLMSLETYARERSSFRAKVLEHKKKRTVQLGAHLRLLFEDELTIRYQVQEMLRIERIFEDQGIQGELDAYNPLIPDGSNWKATMLIEYPDAEERRRMLAVLKGLERRVWVQIEECERVLAFADEDLERENEEKTSSVHFLRFELSA